MFLQYKLTVHQLLFASEETLYNATYYVDQLLNYLKYNKNKNNAVKQIEKAIVDIGKILVESAHLEESIMLYSQIQNSVPEFQGEQS